MNVAHPTSRFGRSRHDPAQRISGDRFRPCDRRAALSAVEQRILWHLQANARITNAELADKVALSPSPCWRKVRALEDRGIIARYTAIVDPVALGLSVEASVAVTLDRHAASDRKAFEDAALALPEIADVHIVSGDADYQLRVLVADTRALGRLLDILAALPGIRSLRSQIVLSSLRRTASFAVPLPVPA